MKCECAACGTTRKVGLQNLRSGMSRGCGCRSKRSGGRKRIPWRNTVTGQRVENTKALANATGLKYLAIVRCLNRGKEVIDGNGHRWEPLHHEAVDHTGPNDSVPWVELDTGRRFASGIELSRHLGIDRRMIYEAINQGRAYCSPDGCFFTPADQRDLPQVPRRSRSWQCVETGEQWPSRKALSDAVGVPTSTIAHQCDDRGQWSGPDGKTYKPA